MSYKTFKGAKDYEKLSHFPFNREFKVRKDLIESMTKHGFVISRLLDIIATDIFTGKLELFIADGQHRAITAAFLDIEFYGAITKTIKQEDYENPEQAKAEIVEYIATLNSGQRPWTIGNYVRAYAYLNCTEYQKLLQIHSKNPFTVGIISGMLSGFKSRGAKAEKIKNGTFKINLEKETKDTLKLVKKIWKYERVTGRMALAIHYVASLTYFNEEKFIEAYKKHAKEVKELKLDDYTDIFASWLK